MLNVTLDSLGLETVRGDESFVSRVQDMPVSKEEFFDLTKMEKYVGVTEQFKDVINTFHTPEGETPAGFKRELVMEKDGVVKVDLVRDISYDKNGILRPTNVLFSADSANPYEVEPISPLISNLTCNPGIIYDLFINNPKDNVGNKYKNRDEVMAEIGRVLGPGCDISVELNNPFEQDFNKILEEAEKFREMFSKYRVVIKVPHTGAVTPQNVTQLLSGNKKLDKRPDQVGTEDALRGHNLALKLHEHGFRVNFTLMFEPFQTMMAMQARPYFINTFLRHRLLQSQNIKKYVDTYEVSKDNKLSDENYSIGVVSAKGDIVVKELVESFLGDKVNETLGEKEGIKRKSAPDSILIMMDTLKCKPEETIYVGDSEVDVETAANAGIKCASVTWGFRDKEDLEKINPLYIADNVQELYELIKE